MVGRTGLSFDTFYPHEVMTAKKIISQSSDYCPGNMPKVSNWSRNSPLSGLMTNTCGVFVSIIQ